MPEAQNNYLLWEGEITVDIKKTIQPGALPEATPTPTVKPENTEMPGISSPQPTAGLATSSPSAGVPKVTGKPKTPKNPVVTQKTAGVASKTDSSQKDAVISISNKVKQKGSSLYGVKKQKKEVGKVHLKKTVYRKKKIYLTWKKVKNASGYQVVFLKRKKWKTRMFKYTRKSKMILSWNGVGKCFVKMRAFHNRGKKRVYGLWSACKQVKRS